MSTPDRVCLRLLDLEAPVPAELLAAVSAEEHARAARFRFDVHRRRFLAGRAALRTVLAELMGVPLAAVQLGTQGDRGKPVVLGNGPLPSFNLSHSDAWGLLAWHAGGLPLGVDLEVARGFRDAEPIARRHFNPRESAAVQEAPEGADRDGVFFRLWTRKEAYLKLTGLGLPGGLRAVEVGPEPVPRLLQPPHGHGLESAWVTSLALPPGSDARLVAALAAPRPVDVAWA